MVNLSRDFIVFGIPHVFSRIDKDRRKLYKERYRFVKRVGIKSVFTASVGFNGFELAKDIVLSKVKARGYKLLWIIGLGPLLQAFSVPLYVLGIAKAQKTAIAMANIGAEILKGEMSLTDTMWIPIDLICFGEIVPCMENVTPLSIYSNETIDVLHEVVEDMLLKD